MVNRPFIATVLFLCSTAVAGAQTIIVRLPTAPGHEGGQGTAPAGAPKLATSAETARPLQVSDIRALAAGTREQLRGLVRRAALDPAITGRTNAAVQSMAVEVGKDGESFAKAKLSWPLDSYNSAVDVIIRGPIAQSTGVPISDRGLASGASVTLGYELSLWGSGVDRSVGRAAQSRIAVASDSSGAPAPDAARLNPLEALIANAMQLAARTNASTFTYADPTLQALNEAYVRDAVATNNPKRIAEAFFATGTASFIRTLSLRGSFSKGSTTFTFAELADPIAETSLTRTDSSMAFNLAYTQLLRDGDDEAPMLLISGGYAKSNAWKASKARQICLPLGVGDATECRSMVIGAPKEETADSLEFDIRSWAYAQKLGINPHFSYDKNTKKWTSEIALSYLVLKETKEKELPQLDSKSLTAGIRVGARPVEEGGVYASIFFGTVLSR